MDPNRKDCSFAYPIFLLLSLNFQTRWWIVIIYSTNPTSQPATHFVIVNKIWKESFVDFSSILCVNFQTRCRCVGDDLWIVLRAIIDQLISITRMSTCSKWHFHWAFNDQRKRWKCSIFGEWWHWLTIVSLDFSKKPFNRAANKPSSSGIRKTPKKLLPF